MLPGTQTRFGDRNVVERARDRTKRRASVGAGLLVASLVLAPRTAHALDCNTLSPLPIYGLGGSATKPLFAKVAAALREANPPLTVVYQAPGACLGINALVNATPITGTASYWDANGTEQSCTLPIAGQAVDFASMGNSAGACAGIGTLPATIGDFLGPINTFNLIVPKASSQASISAEAAYFVFGFGQQGQAQPWVDETQIFRRDANSAAQLFISFATGVPAEKFKGVDTKTNSGTVTQVAQSAKPEAAIGLVSGEVADANRNTVTTLAYQHTGQHCGFTPDSTSTSFDKKNVRNGRYHIWSPLHFFAKVDAQKKIVNADVARFVGYFSGEVEPPETVKMLEIETKAGTVPKCAMSVWRDADLTEVRKYEPLTPCGCYFESVATGTSTCTACADSAACPSTNPVCRYGFCEAR